MSLAYADFLASKASRVQPLGRDCSPDQVHPLLHGWQAEIASWAVRNGRAAVWADTGLGKTLIQLQWARLTGAKTALIVAPLAVCQQTIREAARLDLDVRYTRDGVHGNGLWITNYELADRVDPQALGAVVLDEASILKQHDGVTRSRLIRQFAPVRYRLTCTATPAPNNVEELANQAEFLGTARRVEMLASYFVNDPKAKGWRVKGHARGPMFRWMAGWAIAVRRPSDMGYPDDGYDLPALRIIPQTVPTHGDGQLSALAGHLGGVGGRAQARKATVVARCERAAQLVLDEPDEPWLLWCGLNDEASRLAALIPDALDVRGAWSPEAKAEAILAFASGDIKRLIIKPQIAGFGVNWQHCARMAFVGLSDSYESYYQSMRRCWRYGQTREVYAHVVLSEPEAAIAQNVARKEQEAAALMADLVAAMRQAKEESRM